MYIASFVAMFVSAYAVVYAIDHIYISMGKIYMAALMAGAMGIVNVAVMYPMYKDPAQRIGLLSGSVIVVIVTYLFIRNMTFVGNKEFLKSMIPHHSSAILMCEEADITDPEIEELCDEIVETQREEINQMKDILKRY